MEKHIDEELGIMKDLVMQMWNLVGRQLDKAEESLLTCNKELANEVVLTEKVCNNMDNKISLACENFIALNNPVAIDLRLALAILRINSNLERIGDFAEGISRFVIKDMTDKLDENDLKQLKLKEMFNNVNYMCDINKKAFLEEETNDLGKVFERDDAVDDINLKSKSVVANMIRTNPNKAEEYLCLYSVIKKVERIGDRCNNIAEEIIFYLDANVVKHTR
ncbi:MAG: phosphate signaling complex protein PhoU [Bacteroidales bacterium]|jgi:phosphate transport system protein|nr:phosphate signaling complex protein PhoU [Bacteroidales bacterium]